MEMIEHAHCLCRDLARKEYDQCVPLVEKYRCCLEERLAKAAGDLDAGC